MHDDVYDCIWRLPTPFGERETGVNDRRQDDPARIGLIGVEGELPALTESP